MSARRLVSPALTRRGFLGGSAAALVGLSRLATPNEARAEKPNILFIHTDQQSFDTIQALGARDLRTPNMDRLAALGVSFTESYCANPVCMPARTAWYTGRPPSETGVVLNRIALQRDLPDLGRWLRDEGGYTTWYAGKWHIPGRNLKDSFRVLVDKSLYGEHGDGITSSACAGFLENYEGEQPFFLNAGLLQPHDINYWMRFHHEDIQSLPYPELADRLPPLPPNFEYDAREPESFRSPHRTGEKALQASDWSELQWRYYLWSYLRHVEMVDAEIGRILDGLAGSRHAENSLVVFSSDHGEGMARHKTFGKAFLYEEAAKVPLIVAWPGRIAGGRVDERHLVSALDVVPTCCDYAGTDPLPNARGRSLRGLLEANDEPLPWRDYLVSESTITGRMVRTSRYKLITYLGNEVQQLFDLEQDPWETVNLAAEGGHERTIEEHLAMLKEWEAGLDPVPEPQAGWRSLQKG